MGLFERLNHQGVTLPKGEVFRFENTVKSVKSLGVVLDNAFSWKPRVDQITRKANKALFGRKFMKPCTTQILRKYLNTFMALRAR